MSSNIIVTIVLSGLCILRPKSKFICILFFLFMWTLWAFNVWNGDYVQYLNVYYNPNWDTIEFGFQNLCKILSPILPFQGFMMLLSGVILGLFCYWGIKYTKYPAVYSLIYFPIFILEFVYIRNYICIIIIFYAIFRIVYEHKSITHSVLLVLLASTIHIFSICYLPIIMLLKSNINNKTLLAFVIIFSIISLIASQTVIQSSHYLQWKSDSYARIDGNSFSLTTPFHALIVYISVFISNHSKIQDYSINNTLKIFTKFNILSLILIPVYFILPFASSRFLRCLIVLDIFFYLSILVYATKKTKIYSALGVLFLSACIGYFFSNQTFYYVLDPLYHCNFLWGYDSTYQLISY